MGEVLAQRGCAFQMAISRTCLLAMCHIWLSIGYVLHELLVMPWNVLVPVESQRLLEKSLLSHHQIP